MLSSVATNIVTRFKHQSIFLVSSLYPVPVITGHVVMRTRVRILTGPVATGHWTEAGPFLAFYEMTEAGPFLAFYEMLVLIF